MQFYDPNKLIEDVQALLRSNGLTPDITDSLTAQIGASTLLRGLGITPAIDAEDAYRTGEHLFSIDPHDPLVPGFVLR